MYWFDDPVYDGTEFLKKFDSNNKFTYSVQKNVSQHYITWMYIYINTESNGSYVDWIYYKDIEKAYSKGEPIHRMLSRRDNESYYKGI